MAKYASDGSVSWTIRGTFCRTDIQEIVWWHTSGRVVSYFVVIGEVLSSPLSILHLLLIYPVPHANAAAEAAAPSLASHDIVVLMSTLFTNITTCSLCNDFKGTLFFIVGGYWLLRSLKDPIVSLSLPVYQKRRWLEIGDPRLAS